MPFSRAYRAAPILPSMPRTPNPPGMTTPSTPASAAAAPAGVTQSSLGTQRSCTRARWPKPAARIASLTDRYASGRSTYLPTSATVTVVLRVVHPLQQVVPAGPVHVAEGQAEPAHHVRVQALAVQHLRDVVDARRVRGGDDRLAVDVAVQRQLVLELVRDLPVGAADQRVGLDTDVAQRGHRVLGRLGLQLAATAPGTAPARRAGRSSCPGRCRGGPGGSPPGTAATRCRRPCRRPR